MQSIVVLGDALAEAVAMVLARIAGISGKYRLIHLTPTATVPNIADCAVFVHQEPYGAAHIIERLPKDCRHIGFPSLELRHLWPFTCVNPFNKADPPRYPQGRFPIGDSFIVSCLERGVPPERIVDYYCSVEWNDAWPDLRALEQADFDRLSMLDAKTQFSMVPYIREHLSRARLFWNSTGPTNDVFSELVLGILARMYGEKTPISRKVLTELLHRFGERDLFGQATVPIHPHVARTFGLRWYSNEAKFYYLGEMLGYREYFEQMVRESLAVSVAL